MALYGVYLQLGRLGLGPLFHVCLYSMRAFTQEEKLKESQAASKPTREHNNKLTHRVNELNAAVRSREKQIRILSDENLALKEAKQGLEEEFSRQRRSLKQQLSQGSVYRNERQKLMVRNRELEQANQVRTLALEEGAMYGGD